MMKKRKRIIPKKIRKTKKINVTLVIPKKRKKKRKKTIPMKI